MSVTVRWDNHERTILRYFFEGDWTIEDYYQKLEHGRTMMKGVSHPVCILNDMRRATNYPPNFVTHARTIIKNRPHNTGLAVFLANSAFFNALYRILSQVLPDVSTRYVLAHSEDEAYARIQQWRNDHQNAV